MAKFSPINASWTLTFDDEFNGTSLDPAHWTPNWIRDGPPTDIQKPLLPGVEIAAYDPNQVSVSGGFSNT